MTSETIEQAASRLVQNEVLLCLSSMIHDLSEREGFEDEDFMLELWEGPADYQEAAEASGWKMDEASRLILDPDGEPSGYETWKECCETVGIDLEGREVFEHWAVSGWLAGELQERGETVVNADAWNLEIWARTTTGQAISMDWVIQDVAKGFTA